jgi:hypothetical protein
MGFDFLMVSDSAGTPLAGVMRGDTELTPLARPLTRPPQQGLMTQGQNVYQVASIPVDQGDENIGALSVGERFDFAGFSTPAVLIRDGKVLQSSIPGIPLPEVEAALKACRGLGECDLLLGGADYISLPLEG